MSSRGQSPLRPLCLLPPVEWSSRKRPSLRAGFSASLPHSWSGCCRAGPHAGRIRNQSRLTWRRVGLGAGSPGKPLEVGLLGLAEGEASGWCTRPAPAGVPLPPGTNCAALCVSRCWTSCPSCCSSTGSSMRCVSMPAREPWGSRCEGGLHKPCRAMLAQEAACGPFWAPHASWGRPGTWGLPAPLCGKLCFLIHPSLPPLVPSARPVAELTGGHSPCPQENSLAWGHFLFIFVITLILRALG